MTHQDHKIRVDVETSYLDEQSDPRERRFVFSYTITIRNEGQVPARLLTRHWVITDANGKVEEVRGDGVVGEQPYLKPGQGFRYSSGAVQGCHEELRALLALLKFSPDRDRLWFVGDLVNRGPRSLETLRLVRSLGDNAVVVLGNHDLHLLAVVHGSHRRKKSDTLDAVLAAPDRDQLLEWLLTRPMAHGEAGDLMVHAGVVPQWSVALTLELAREVEAALRREPR